MAGIHLVQGENDGAAVLYRRIVRDYPVAELYDKCRKTLADLLLRQGRYEECLQELDGMVYFDPVYTPEEIHASRCGIIEQWVRSDPTVEPMLIRCHEEFLEQYPDSETAKRYRQGLD
jgi:hypothetical protein